MKWAWVCLVMGAGLPVMAADPAQQGQAIAPPTRIPDPVMNSLVVPAAGSPVTVATVPRELRQVVVADAAKHLNVSENAVVLTRAEQVNWSDGSLGCPRPGMSYSQALVPGYRLVARSAERELVYHTDTSRHAIRCEEPVPARGQRPPDGEPGNDAQPRTQPPTPTTPDR